MSDNINYNRLRGSYSFVSVREPAWHRLGKTVEHAMTINEAIELANLDFQVDKTECYANSISLIDGIETSSMKIVPNKFATYRKDNGDILGCVGNSYKVVQNREALSFFDEFLHESDAVFQTAGALGKGEVIFISAKLPSYIKVGYKDKVEQYLLLSTSHDGTSSVQIMFTPIRVVCNNTLNAALSTAGSKIKIRHTNSANSKLKEAHRIMGITNERSKFMQEIYPSLSKVRVDDKEVKDYINHVFLTKDELALLSQYNVRDAYRVEEISTRKANIIDDVYKAYFVGPGQQLDTAKGTMWGAYNAVTCYFQNIKSIKSDDKAMRSNFYGSNYEVMQKAFNLAVNQ